MRNVSSTGLLECFAFCFSAKEVRNVESASRHYTNELISVVNRGIAQGWDESLIKRRVESVLQQSERRVKTAVETVRRAASIQAVYEKATEAFNDPWMRYTGPSGANSRAFCRNYLGVVKRASEWAQIQNGQTGAVLPWVGGYNCRHRLVVARDREEFLERYLSDKNFVRLKQDDDRYYGFVVRHRKSNPDKNEIEHALFDAKQGRFVRLLQEGVGGVRSFDTQTDEFFTEYKTMSDAKSESGVVQHLLKSLRKIRETGEDAVVIIWIRQQMDFDKVKERAKGYLDENDKIKRIKKVVFRFGLRDIEYEQIYSREEIEQW